MVDSTFQGSDFEVGTFDPISRLSPGASRDTILLGTTVSITQYRNGSAEGKSFHPKLDLLEIPSACSFCLEITHCSRTSVVN